MSIIIIVIYNQRKQISEQNSSKKAARRNINDTLQNYNMQKKRACGTIVPQKYTDKHYISLWKLIHKIDALKQI